MAVQRRVAELIVSIPASSRWKVDREADVENKDVQGRTIPRHLGRIAAEMTDWEGTIADLLGLTEVERADIMDRYPQKPELQWREALSRWKSRRGIAATYRALMEVFFRAGRMDLAESVAGILKEGAEVTDELNPQPGTVVIHESETPGSASVTHLNDSDHSIIYKKLAPHAARWRDIGRELGFTEGEMNNIESYPMLMMQGPRSWLGELLSQWLQWALGDGRGSTGFATRESLQRALLRVNLGQLAEQFHTPSGDHSHEGPGDHTSQHSSQAEGRDQHTVNGNGVSQETPLLPDDESTADVSATTVTETATGTAVVTPSTTLEEGNDVSQETPLLMEQHDSEITADVSAIAVTEAATGPTVIAPATTQEEGHHRTTQSQPIIIRISDGIEDGVQDFADKPLSKYNIIMVVVIILVVTPFLVSFLVFLIRLVLGEFMCHKPSLNSLPSKFNVTNIVLDGFFDFLLTMMEILHTVEHGLLTYYLFQFYKSWKDSPALIQVKDFMKRKLILIVGIISLALVILLLIFRLVFIRKLQIEISQQPTDELCDQSIIIALDYIYHVVSIINKIIVLFVRFMMMYFTLMIELIWKMEGARDENATLLPQHSNQEQHSDKEQYSDQGDIQVDIFYQREYEKREKLVIPIYKIFQSFFVFQLIIHLFGFIFHCSHLIRSWTQHGRKIVIDPSLLVILHRLYQFFHLIFDCLALVIAHICAVKMIGYAKQYIENLKPDEERNRKRYNSFKGNCDPNSRFMPKIPGTGVNIPLNSPGFVCGVVLSVFAIIITFIFL